MAKAKKVKVEVKAVELPKPPVPPTPEKIDSISKEELEDIPVTAEQMEEFKFVEDSLIPEKGDNNLAPLELTPELEKEILEKQNQDDIKRQELSNETKHFNNGKNVWRLISKTYNNLLGWEHTTMAMAIGNRGVAVHVKEAIDQKVNSTSFYIDNGKLEQDDEGQWLLK